MATETTPASSEARAPQTTRDSTSRPISSVPNRCSALGALRMSLQLVCTGSKGAISGAASAMVTKTTTTASPKTAARRLSSRRQARRDGVSSRGEAVARSAAAVVTASSPQPRIGGEVGEIGDQVQHDVRRSREQHDTLDDGVVAIEHRIDDQLAEAGNGEHLLGQHRAGKE